MKMFLLITAALLTCGWGATAAEPEGFGAAAQGGAGGRVLTVTRKDDNPDKPSRGSLRWALRQKGARIIRFAVQGDIRLRERIVIQQDRVTVDGSTAPGNGICIRGGALEFRGTREVILRHLRIRLGDETTLAANKRAGRKRPANSNGLDCLTLTDCNQVLVEHCSFSWSCDELIGITRSRNVTLQWCIFAEPLSSPRLHPYGDTHAYALNASASTLSVHHCLFAHFHIRGPQFEVNDLHKSDKYSVSMEAVNNVVFGYHRSGSRYVTGIETGDGTASGKTFRFQFLKNYYVPAPDGGAAIEVVSRHGVVPGLSVGIDGNVEERRGVSLLRRNQADAGRPVVTAGPLFEAPVPVSVEDPREARDKILKRAGCGPRRDAVDERIIQDVKERRFRALLKSQDDVGGWPDL